MLGWLSCLMGFFAVYAVASAYSTRAILIITTLGLITGCFTLFLPRQSISTKLLTWAGIVFSGALFLFTLIFTLDQLYL